MESFGQDERMVGKDEKQVDNQIITFENTLPIAFKFVCISRVFPGDENHDVDYTSGKK